MNKILKDAVNYSGNRISIEDISIENYVTTDNLLQNKQGKVNVESLPLNGGNVTKYEKGDVLISNIRPYLKKIWYATYSGGSSADVLTLKVNKNYDSNFIYYTLFQDKLFEHMMNGSKGTKMPRGDKNQILNFPIPNFPLPTQKSIAKVLSNLDKKIELNNKIIKELETMAKELYDYWFVQFDFPDANGKPYRSNGGKMVYNTELKREIPEGWEVSPINSKVIIGSGFPFNSDDYTLNGMYKIITIKNVQDGFLDTSAVDYISSLPTNISNFCILNEGDVLMSLTGNVGRMCIVDETNLLLNQRVGKLIGDMSFVNYAYFFFKRPENQKRLEKLAGGSSQANLSPIEAVKDTFPIPAQFVLKKFSEKIKPLKKQILNNNRENKELSKLRDWILPMLMNGQVTVGGLGSEEVKDTSKGKVPNTAKDYDQRFEMWIKNQALAARGTLDKTTLREIFDAMDDDDK